MAFPIVESLAASASTVDGTSVSATMPATVNAGDLLVVLVSYYTGVNTTHPLAIPIGWTVAFFDFVGTGVNSAAFYKTAEGNEDGTTVSFPREDSGTLTGVAQVARISGAGLPADSLEFTAPVKQPTSATIDFVDTPSITPSWGVADNLYLIFGGIARGVSTFTTLPAGYTTSAATAVNGAGDDVGGVMGHKQAATATETPDDFIGSTYNGMIAVTAVVKEPGPAITLASTNFTPNATITCTLTNFTTYPPEVILTDISGNTLTLPLTQVLGDEHTFTLPAAPALGSSVQLLKAGDVTVSATGVA